MRYVTAMVGAILVFLGVSVITLLLTGFLPPLLRPTVSFGFVSDTFPAHVSITNPLGLIGVILAYYAGRHSYHSTLKRIERKASAGEADRPKST